LKICSGCIKAIASNATSEDDGGKARNFHLDPQQARPRRLVADANLAQFSMGIKIEWFTPELIATKCLKIGQILERVKTGSVQ
jgi:hypothetical protein